jgi:hypothetical protein
MLARMMKCTHFVPILTEPYRRRVEVVSARPVEDGWVFDEYQLALLLSQRQRILFMGLWRSGPALARPFDPDKVIDFRDDAKYADTFARYFPFAKVLVIGLRANGTARSVGPMGRAKAASIVDEFRRTGEFAHIEVVDFKPR